MSKFRKQHMAIPWHELVEQDSDTKAINASLKEKATLVGRMGLSMLSVGTGAWRVRASMNKVSRALGITCNADIGLLAISYTCIEGGETYTNSISINTTGVNTDKVYYLDLFADSFAERVDKYSVEQFHSILDNIMSATGHYKAWQLGLSAGFACAAFTFLLGGGPIEMICALFGAGFGNFVRKKMLERHITLFANVCVGVAAACTVYVLLIKLAEHLANIPPAHQAGYICSMLFVIPGFPLITGGIDLAKLDLRSGIERITYALLIIVVATLTAWVMATVYHFKPADFEEFKMDEKLRFALWMVTSFVGVYGFSMMFNSTKKMASIAGCLGMCTNTFRLSLIEFAHAPIPLAAFIGALCSGLIASGIKKEVGVPRITLTVPSIVIMVPGMFMYKGIYYIALNDLANGGLWLSKALLIVMSLPLGLICARILTDENFRKSS